jgi:hypothetical protein
MDEIWEHFAFIIENWIIKTYIQYPRSIIKSLIPVIRILLIVFS